ncbi:MAG: hypothetical protein MUC96_06250 [Myxococcaceae bacterium]|jgi:hypothetical protein|nr:hypothetical protein [Myxococcaceae bacterium]
MESSESQQRLVEVSSSRVREALARWWFIETRFLGLLKDASRDASGAGLVDLGAERSHLEGLTEVMQTRLPDLRLPRTRARRGRSRRGTFTPGPGAELREVRQLLVDENRAVSAEVSNLCDLFHEWEQADLAALMQRSLDLHRRIEQRFLTRVGPAVAQEGSAAPVRFIAGVRRGPVSPWGAAP